MAKKRKNGSLNDANRKTPRQRQEAAASAAGLKFKYHTGYGGRSDKRTFYFGPATQGPLDNPKYLAITRPNSWTVQDVKDEMYRNVARKVPKSKKAQAKFLASEKKKSGKATANNVKRRER